MGVARERLKSFGILFIIANDHPHGSLQMSVRNDSEREMRLRVQGVRLAIAESDQRRRKREIRIQRDGIFPCK